jgi:hypothetical protein
MQLEYKATNYVRDAIRNLGRTEDIRFSPNNRRLAVVSFLTNKITVFGIVIAARNITITDAIEISSSYLKEPHGIDFIDDDKIIVANRQGGATIFELPRSGVDRHYDLEPLAIIPIDQNLSSPGNITIIKKDKYFHEALICNNYANRVTRHLIDIENGFTVTRNEILLRKWLSLPDGISVSGNWIAVSNNKGHNVLLYESTESLGEHSNPDGVLRCVRYPHGLRFTADGRFILVADAGAPYVHIYAKNQLGWKGVHQPLRSIRVLNDIEYCPGQTAIYDAGPKGLDIDNCMSTLAVTCDENPMAFFELPPLLDETLEPEQLAFLINYELDSIPCDSQEELKHEIAGLIHSTSWQVTAPLRWLGSTLKR